MEGGSGGKAGGGGGGKPLASLLGLPLIFWKDSLGIFSKRKKPALRSMLSRGT